MFSSALFKTPIKRFLVALLLAVVLLLAPTNSSSAQAAEASQSGSVVEPGVSDSIVRLYNAVFDRDPDGEGLDYWVELYSTGTSLSSIADEFIVSQEWELRYEQPTDSRYVELLYRNVLDRTPDQEGGAYWRQQLADGLSRTELLLYFSESNEFVIKTRTAVPVAPSVFPVVPFGSGFGKRVVYDNDGQRVWLIDRNEKIVDSYLVSGREQTPGPGTYSVFSKSPLAWAGHDGITMEYMVRFTYGRSLAIGFHAIPLYANGAPMQTEGQLGTYQSAGCIRQNLDKAKALYEWADLGTTVVVLP